MENLNELGDPPEFWEYFYQISKIPRCSGKEDNIRQFIENEANKLGFQTEIDHVKNLLVWIPSKLNQANKNFIVVLQSHMDMICEKNEGIKHNFSSDPLKLKLIELENEKWVTAEGTTLGADNGVGIAYQLAIMKKISNGDLDFGPWSIKLLFTVDEEGGLLGASQIKKEMGQGAYLLNLDSEEDSKFTIGCAGGNRYKVEIKIERSILDQNSKNFIPVKISIKGLIGGHSGTDINKRRANALKLISQILWKLNKKFVIKINSIDGGHLSNAIPREANSIFFLNERDFSELVEEVNKNMTEIRKIFDGIETDMEIKVDKLDVFSDNTYISEEIQSRVLDIFYLLPNGPIIFHPIMNNLVHSSSNFGSIKTKEDSIKFVLSQRSFTDYDKDVLHDKVISLLNLSKLDYRTYKYIRYPGWSPNFDSKISKIASEIYQELFNEKVKIQAIHAGLECAYFKYYYPQMELISFGPDILGGHSPDERLRVESVEKIWKFLISLIKNLK
ncbi:MAG: beta-Ala-His dipeptidase [Candidatus Hodarchaeota archaeon]